MFFPIRTDSPLRSTPYVNWALILINIAVFVAQRQFFNSATPMLALYPHDPRLHSFITYAFLHGGVAHLVGNMLFLYIFGNNVNDKMGHIGYLAFYLSGAIIAGVAYVLMSTGTAPVVGASGAIAAVTGAYLVLFPRSSITVFYMFLFIGSFEVPSFYFILFFFGQDLFLNFAGDSGVAHTAHIGGTVFGFGICLALLAVHLLPRDQFDVLALLQRANKRRQYRDMVSKGYNPFGYVSSPRDLGALPAPPDPKTQKVLDLRASIAEAIAHHELPKAAALYQDLKALDAAQVLPRQAQLDIANQLAAQQLYPEAAEAYESFLRHYPKFEQIEQVELMLGLVYARYLQQYDKAREHLVKAIAHLHGDREIAMARSELARIDLLAAEARGPR